MGKEKEETVKTGLKAEPVIPDGYDLINCIVRDRYDEKNRSVHRDYQMGKDGVEYAVWFRLGEPTKITRRTIQKLKRRVPEPSEMPAGMSPLDIANEAERGVSTQVLRPPRYTVEVLDF